MVPTPDPSGVIPSFAIPSATASGPRPSPARLHRRRSGVTVGIGERPAVGVADAQRERTAERAARHAGADADAHRDADSHADSDPDAHADSDAEGHAKATTVVGALGAGGCSAEPVRSRARPVTLRAVTRRLPASRSRMVTAAVIDLRGVTVRRSGRTILGPIDWTVRDGERWVVIGPNGCGQDDPAVGRRARRCGRRREPWTSSVRATGGSIRASSAGGSGRPGAAIEAMLRDDLTPVDAGHDALATRRPSRGGTSITDDDRSRPRSCSTNSASSGSRTIATGRSPPASGGATSIARALMPDPDLLLLDEPAANLDLGARETLVARPGRAGRQPATGAIVLVTHHVEEIPPGFIHALVLADGPDRGRRAARRGPVADDVLSRAFGLPIAVERRDGRAWARMTPRSRPTGP